MAFQSVQDAASLTLLWAQGTAFSWRNVFTFSKSGFTFSDMETLGEVADEAFSSSGLSSYLSTSVALLTATVTDLRTQGLPQAVEVIGYAGQVTQDPVSPGLAVVVTLRTALRGRAYRGRVYLSGFVEGEMDNGAWSNAVINAADAAIESLKSLTALEGWTLSVVSRQLDGVPRLVGITTPVTTIEVRSNKPGTQRKRIARP
jgi:hypothetical protein